MKKIILALVLSTISVLSLNAQWTPSGSNIYYDAGTVGIGSSSLSYGELTIISDGQRPLGIRRNTDSGSLIRWNIGSGIVGGIYSSGTGTGIYGGSTESESQFFLSSNGNIGIGTTTPASVLDVAGDIQYSGIGYTDFVRKQLTGFVSSERLHYLLLYKYDATNATTTVTRITGQFTGVRSHGSSSPSSLIMQIEAGRGTLSNRHDVNVQYSSISGGSNNYRIKTVTLEYNGDNYVAIEIDPRANHNIITQAYYEGITLNSTLEVVVSNLVSNVIDYTSSNIRKKTGFLSPIHIYSGSSGGNVHAISGLTVEDSVSAMISVLTPNDKSGYYGFSDTDDDFVGGMHYDHATDDMFLRVNNHSVSDSDLTILSSGNVGIGTITPSYKLAVNGTIRSKEVIVEATGWPDYVFEENYNLLSLAEIEAFIKANGHLPEIPSATEVEANGITLGEMNTLLLKKIEELTLHSIEQEKTLLEQQQTNNKIIRELLLRIEAIEKQNDQ